MQNTPRLQPSSPIPINAGETGTAKAVRSMAGFLKTSCPADYVVQHRKQRS